MRSISSFWATSSKLLIITCRYRSFCAISAFAFCRRRSMTAPLSVPLFSRRSLGTKSLSERCSLASQHTVVDWQATPIWFRLFPIRSWRCLESGDELHLLITNYIVTTSGVADSGLCRPDRIPSCCPCLGCRSFPRYGSKSASCMGGNQPYRSIWNPGKSFWPWAEGTVLAFT